ncbi:peptide deformylase [Candidatus Poriferisodalis sp.]|uniref:peptide deformylase n=1 Tax=Candidatus Poriferisodalis sp. TaxID=3101277 RepID=UPI003B025ACB
MTVRDILSIGHPALRRSAAVVPQSEIASECVQGIVDDLIDTMRHANGAGLAANQIGETVRIVVIEVNENPRYPYKPPIELTVAINPELEVRDDETVVINEGCLSVPLRGDVVRSVNLGVRYFDREGTEHCSQARGLTAGTWQHECDHLDGVLITDRADPSTLCTWDEFERHYRDAFIERISRFNERMPS